MKKNKITEINGRGTLTGATGIDVVDADVNSSSYTFDNLIIATGSHVRMLPGFDKIKNIVTYEEQILDENLSRSVLICVLPEMRVRFAYVLTHFRVCLPLH